MLTLSVIWPWRCVSVFPSRGNSEGCSDLPAFNGTPLCCWGIWCGVVIFLSIFLPPQLNWRNGAVTTWHPSSVFFYLHPHPLLINKSSPPSSVLTFMSPSLSWGMDSVCYITQQQHLLYVVCEIQLQSSSTSRCSVFLLVCLLNMDVAAIRNLMRKTQTSIIENGFLGLDNPKHVSVASFTSLLILKCVFLKRNQNRSATGWGFHTFAW